jgi:hypothetical protein
MNPTIAIQGEHFVLSFEAHTIRIPLRDPDKLIAVLKARQRGALRIAEAGSPVQSMIDRPTERAQIDAFCANRRDATFAELGL